MPIDPCSPSRSHCTSLRRGKPVDASDNAGRGLLTIGRLILAVLLFGVVVTLIELILLAHYEDVKQLIPLGLLVLAPIVLILHVIFPRTWSVWVFQATMLLLVVAGILGVFFHYEGSKEFQLEMDSSLSGMTLFWKIVQAKAPPTLAPGLMIQLGILGLVHTLTRKPRN